MKSLWGRGADTSVRWIICSVVLFTVGLLAPSPLQRRMALPEYSVQIAKVYKRETTTTEELPKEEYKEYIPSRVEKYFIENAERLGWGEPDDPFPQKEDVPREKLTTAGSPVMHTFFEPTDKPCCGMSNEGHLSLVKAWEKSWQDRGWTTRVLTKEDAMKHPEFEALSRKLSELNVNEYNQRCFWRWMAMVGTSKENGHFGGWMSDYDTFPLGLSAEEGLEIENRPGFKTFGLHVPNLIHAPPDGWDRVLHALFEVMPKSSDHVDKDYEDCPVISDMCMLLYAQRKFTSKAIGITYWEDESVDGFVYNANAVHNNQPLEMDCSYAKRFRVAHLSHEGVKEAFKEKHNYPMLDGIGDGSLGSLFERRHEAALVMMEDFRELCLEPNSSATKNTTTIRIHPKTLSDPKTCDVWKYPNATNPETYDGLQAYAADLDRYLAIVQNITRLSGEKFDVLEHIQKEKNHDICSTLKLHQDGLPGIFASDQLSLSKSGWIEPLTPPMRFHKFCFNTNPDDGSHMETLDYLVHDFEIMCRHLKPNSKRVLIDMGAALDFGNGNQPIVALMRLYEKFGFYFDHIYAFELKHTDPTEVFENLLPEEYFTAYHWINTGVNHTKGHKMNPLNSILSKFAEDDFIIIKIDIDTSFIEVPLVHQLLEGGPDGIYYRLVDQFYFEHHVHLGELARWWGGSMNGTVKDSLDLFYGLRERGIPAHFWP